MKAQSYFEAMASIISKLEFQQIDAATDLVLEKIKDGASIYICGNGGSASTASHYITDWSKMPWILQKRRVKAYCLNDNVGMLTAYGNDLSYAETFSETLSNYASVGDLLIVISGSGNSENILAVLRRSRELGVTSLAVVGFDGGKAKELADYCLHFPVNDMQLVEDCHLMFGHLVMKSICNG